MNEHDIATALSEFLWKVVIGMGTTLTTMVIVNIIAMITQYRLLAFRMDRTDVAIGDLTELYDRVTRVEVRLDERDRKE